MTAGPMNCSSKAQGRRIGDYGDAVCRIVIKNKEGEIEDSGTGFLIGPNLIMTCHHVIPDLETAQRAEAQFFKLSNEVKRSTGGERNLHSHDYVKFNSSPEGFFHSPALRDKDGFFLEANQDYLDYTILQLQPDPCLVGRVCFSLFDAKEPQLGNSCTIYQHPDVSSLDVSSGIEFKGAFGQATGNIVKVADYECHYATPTAPGSSGGPVVDAQGNLVALHYQGPIGEDSECPKPPRHACNAGVLICKIIEDLKQKNQKKTIKLLCATPHEAKGSGPSTKELCESLKSPWPTCALQALPSNVNDLGSFFASLNVTGYEIEQIRNVKTIMLNGATGLHIAFLAVSNFGYSAPMQSLKHKYLNFTQSICHSFSSIKSNNTRVLDAFAAANKRLPRGDINYILEALQEVATQAEANVAKCNDLNQEAESLRQEVQEESCEFAGHRDRFQHLQYSQKVAEEKLQAIKEEIRGRETEITDEISNCTEGRFELKPKSEVSQERLSQRHTLEQAQIHQGRLDRDRLLDELKGIQSEGMSEQQARELFISALQIVILGLDRVGTGLADLSKLFHNFGELSLLGAGKVNFFQLQYSSSAGGVVPNAQIANFLEEFEMAGRFWLTIADQGNKIHKILDTFQVLELTEPDFKKHLNLAKEKLALWQSSASSEPVSDPTIAEIAE